MERSWLKRTPISNALFTILGGILKIVKIIFISILLLYLGYIVIDITEQILEYF